jgi:hypothetical protein
MSEPNGKWTGPPQSLLTQVSVAREHALNALESMVTDHPSGAAETEAMVALQDAANQLGRAERALSQLECAGRQEPAPILESAEKPSEGGVEWSAEASAVFALAEFTVPYATGPADVVEDWLRALRREGTVGRALAELGFADGELIARATPAGTRRMRSVERVRAKSIGFARQRDAKSVTTTDVLFAVLAIYGKLVDRVFYERGFTRSALLDQVAGGARAMARLSRTAQL